MSEEINNIQALNENSYEWIEKNGKKILYLNFKNRLSEGIKKVIQDTEKIIRTAPEQSLLTIADFTDGHYDKEAAELLKVYAAKNKPFIKRSAVVGIKGIKMILFNTVVKFSGRDLRLVNNIDEAIDYLLKD